MAFVDSHMMGLTAEDITLSDVLFQGCQFDYATLNRIRVKGSVAFVNCRFREAIFTGGDLDSTVFDDCLLSGVEFDSAKMTGTDIRECEVSGISGVSSLKGGHVAPNQLPELFDAFTKDLGLKVSEV